VGLLIELVHNITLLFALTFIYSLIIPRTNGLSPAIRNVLQGTAFGLFGILAMASAIPVGNGFLIDGRNVILAIAGGFTGIVPTAIAACIMIVYRLILGGAGVWPSIPTLLVTAAVSLVLFRHREKFAPLRLCGYLILLGIVIALQEFFWIALLGGNQSAYVIGQIFFPLYIFTPLGTILLGFLLYYQQRQFEVASALRASEERYRIVVNSMNEGVILQNAVGGMRTTNPAAASILGLTDDQIQGHVPHNPTWKTIYPDGTLYARENHPSLVAIRTGQAQTNIVMGIQKPDSTLTWINVNSQPLFAPGNKLPYAALTTLTDITPIRQAQENLRQERDLLRTLIDSSPDYIFLKDAEGRFILTNTAHSYAAGNIQPDDLIGKTAFDVFAPPLAAQFHADDQKIMLSGEALINAERETVDAQGNRKFVLTTKIPWRGKDGKILGLVGISRDITERKQLQAQKTILEAEQERVRVLQRFIADMSHDFRTPLSVINSSTYLLHKITDPEKREEKIRNIELQSDRLLKLLDDQLEMGRLDEKSLPFQFTKEDINPIVQTVVTNFQVMADSKNQTLAFIPTPNLPEIDVDVLKFSRALIHLVQNAISYTPASGQITLRTDFENDHVILSISDNGIGIAEGDLLHIFERFYRVDHSRASTTGGSGLGLPIVKRIVESHNGTIAVKSTLGKGSIFTLNLPISAERATKTG
jgi:PAS domain S-box-containing protein